MIRINRSEPTSQLGSTDIGLVYFKCKDQERGCPNATLDGTLNVNCRGYYVWIWYSFLCLNPDFDFDLFLFLLTITQRNLLSTNLFSRHEWVLSSLQHFFFLKLIQPLWFKKFMAQLEFWYLISLTSHMSAFNVNI